MIFSFILGFWHLDMKMCMNFSAANFEHFRSIRRQETAKANEHKFPNKKFVSERDKANIRVVIHL